MACASAWQGKGEGEIIQVYLLHNCTPDHAMTTQLPPRTGLAEFDIPVGESYKLRRISTAMVRIISRPLYFPSHGRLEARPCGARPYLLTLFPRIPTSAILILERFSTTQQRPSPQRQP